MQGTNASGSQQHGADFALRWDSLHREPRFRPHYPSEHVVRFLRGLPPRLSPGRDALRALDIGCGAGRHTFLLAELGFTVGAVDVSSEGLRFTGESLASAGYKADLLCAPMTALPFPDESFDVIVSYGVFYYGPFADGRAAIGELRRVMKPAARALVVVRSTDDYRYGKGTLIERGTFRCETNDTNEQGMVIHFLDEDDVKVLYGGFGELSFELTETTFLARTAKNSDWLITVEK